MRVDGSRRRRPDLLDIIGRWAAAAPVFLFRSHFRVRGNSMTPSLRDGDLVHVLPRRCATRGLARGAVVVAAAPHGFDRLLVKRVVGLPGEHIRVSSDGIVRIDDAPLRESYLDSAAGGAGATASQWLCGDDEYFLMGDNRADSGDSRRYGPLPDAAIIGKVWLRWPTRRPGRPARKTSWR